jgi:hypothetical protein
MLTRRTLPLAAALLLGMLPPLTGEAEADEPRWSSQLVDDLVEARRVTRGQGVTIALLGDGVEPVKALDGALLAGRDFVGTERPKREYGTLIASLLVDDRPAQGSALPVAGLVPGAKVLPVRVYPAEDDPGADKWAEEWLERGVLPNTFADGIRHAVDNGAQVIAVEGWQNDTVEFSGGAVLSAVAYARSKNALVVTVSGTYKMMPMVPLPIGAPGVLGIGVVGEDGRRDKEVNDATTTTLVSAPGMAHDAIGSGNEEYEFWGPGPALAWGAAAAAMVRSEYPKLTPTQVIEAITSSARHPGGKGRYDTDLGYGYINPIGALSAAEAIARREAARPPKPEVGDDMHFGGDPGRVRAVPYDPALLAGFGGVVGAGLAVAVVGLWLMIRRPGRPAEPAEPAVATGPLPPDDPSPVAAEAVDGPESAGASGS